MDIVSLVLGGETSFVYMVILGLLLGGLHGLEPGHSKTMMAAFIIAVRGTVGQAVILGACAALSHSLIVWALAIAALELGDELVAEQAEPYLIFVSGVVIIVIAFIMLKAIRHHGGARGFLPVDRHGRDHTHDHGHHHEHGQRDHAHLDGNAHA